MIDKKNRLVEDKWYHVHLEDDPFRKDVIKVNGKYYFIGRLVVHVGNKLVFNLNNEDGSVVIPFDNVKWMVPLYNPELKIEAKTEYWDIKYNKENKGYPWEC